MAHYVHYGVLLISEPNLVVIGLMVVVFALMAAMRLPHSKGGD
jgi:hypothetical protein